MLRAVGKLEQLGDVRSEDEGAHAPAHGYEDEDVDVLVPVRVRVLVLAILLPLAVAACNANGAPAPPSLQDSPPNSSAAPPPKQPASPPQELVAVPKPDEPAARPAIDFTTPESAMAVLTYAMQAKDAALLLDCFAKGAWTSVNTVEKPWGRTKLTYDSLAAGLKPGGDYRGFLFGDDGEDSFRTFFTGPNKSAWKSAGKQRFEAPESSPDQPTYVQWKKQGPRYVVSEIAFPAD